MKNFAAIRKIPHVSCAALLLAAMFLQAQAQTWPSKPVRLVIGMAPGGGSDLLARALANRLSPVWGQPVVVENRPGATSVIATEVVAKSAPDGHTILFSTDSSFTVTPHLYSKLPYDVIRDFTAITQITEFGTVLVAHAALPVSTAAELIALAKKEPGKITYGSIGSGSQMHLISEMLNNKAGITLLHIPYKGIPQMMTAVLTGEVNLVWVGVFSARPQVKAGKIKPLVYSGARRSVFMPEVPSVVEIGYPDVEKGVWYGVLAPARTSRPLIDRMHADIKKLLDEPEFREKELLAKGYEPTGLGPDEFAALIRRQYAAGANLVRVSGAVVE
ncbi:MAG: tripartite tricarboxylate transporter substrate binding protein [Betaproteobacteria bacterium]|nr:tripartite tricarboxylate transporter substrate binding protein [Betaproteobacteria bacterium]